MVFLRSGWRAVAGASQMLKLFEYCILEIWGSCIASDNLQFGFKAGTGTDQCSWLLLSTAEYFVQRGSPTLCCLLDVSKGFDRVKFSTLFNTLLKKGLPAIVVRVMVFSYTEQDLTCSPFRGLNSDDFPFFYFLSRPSRTRVRPV